MMNVLFANVGNIDITCSLRACFEGVGGVNLSLRVRRLGPNGVRSMTFVTGRMLLVACYWSHSLFLVNFSLLLEIGHFSYVMKLICIFLLFRISFFYTAVWV